LGGVLHRPAAEGHEAQAVRERERAGQAQGGVLAQREARGGGEREVAVLLGQGPEAGDRAGVDGGLGDVGAVERLGGTFEAQGGERLAERAAEDGVGLREDFTRGGAGGVPRPAHRDGLGALAGAEDDGGGGHGGWYG